MPSEKNKSLEKEKGKKWDGTSRPSSNNYKENWDEIYGQKEQKELNESGATSIS